MVEGNSSSSRLFSIHAGVRQGCVLVVFRFHIPLGLVPYGGTQNTAFEDWFQCRTVSLLLGLSFADYFFMFVFTKQDAIVRWTCHCVGASWSGRNLIENKDSDSENSTIFLATTARRHAHSSLVAGKWPEMVELHFICAQSWRAAIEIFITVCRLHLGFYILIVEHTMMSRLTYFANMITSLAWFGAGHGTIYQTDLPKMDVEMRRLLRVVGPPPSAWQQWCSGQIWNLIPHGFDSVSEIGAVYFEIACLRYISHSELATLGSQTAWPSSDNVVG